MKSRLNLLMLLLTLFAFGAGCSGDVAEFAEADGSMGVDPNSNGYLSFSGFSLSVDELGEQYTDVENDRVTATTTRSSSVNTDNFIVRVISESTSTEVYREIYKNISSQSPVTLSAGAYTVEVMSCEDDDIPLAGFDCPTYKGSKRCVVGNEASTQVGEIVCTMSNIMTSVEMSIDLLERFNPTPSEESNKLKITLEVGDYELEVGDNELEFDPTQEEYGYFRVPDDGIITVYLSGMYNITPDEDIPTYFTIFKGDWVETVENVKAGQYRNISVKIDYNATGTIAIKLEIETWSYETELDLDITSTKSKFLSYALAEDVIEDPESGLSAANSPEVSLDGGLDMEAVYTITSSIFDIDTKTYSPLYKAYIAPVGSSTVKSVSINVQSTAAGFSSLLSDAGFDENGELMIYSTEETLSTSLSDYLSVRKDTFSEQVIAAVTYDGMLELSKYIGEHTVIITATDSENRTSYTTLNLETIYSGGPDIVWEGGYDFDTAYNVYTETEITAGKGENPVAVISITSNSAAGFTSLTLSIISDVLTKEILEGDPVYLSDYMDLINAEGTIESGLKKMGIPVGDEVAGQSYLEIDITEFMPLLAGLGAGTSNFTITAGDATGMNAKTVKIVRD